MSTALCFGKVVDKRCDNFGVKVVAGLLFDVGDDFLFGPGFISVGAGISECIPNVYNRKDACSQWDLFTLEAIWVAVSVPPFMVIKRNFEGRFEEGNGSE